jgi:hypothetical protein
LSTAPFRMPGEAPSTAVEYGRLFHAVLSNPNHIDHARASAEWMALSREEARATFGDNVDAPLNPNGVV